MSDKLKVLLTVRPLWLLVAAALLAFVGGIFTPVSEQVRGPLVDINDTIMIAVLVAFGGFVLNLYNRIGKMENDLQMFRAENGQLRDDLRAATTFIDRVGLWMVAGMPATKRPRPPQQLAKHVDAELWQDDHPIGGTTT